MQKLANGQQSARGGRSDEVFLFFRDLFFLFLFCHIIRVGWGKRKITNF